MELIPHKKQKVAILKQLGNVCKTVGINFIYLSILSQVLIYLNIKLLTLAFANIASRIDLQSHFRDETIPEILFFIPHFLNVLIVTSSAFAQ